MSQTQDTKQTTIEATDFFKRFFETDIERVIVSFDYVRSSSPFYVRLARDSERTQFPMETAAMHGTRGSWSLWYLYKGQAEVERISVERSVVKTDVTIHLKLKGR